MVSPIIPRSLQTAEQISKVRAKRNRCRFTGPPVGRIRTRCRRSGHYENRDRAIRQSLPNVYEDEGLSRQVA